MDGGFYSLFLFAFALGKINLRPTKPFLFTVKNNYSVWSKKGDRSLKRVKSYSKWSENLLKMEWNLKFTPFRVRFYSFYRTVPFLLHIFYSVTRFTKGVIATPMNLKTEPPNTSNWYNCIDMSLFFPYIPK